jgi:hypothetical protein
VASQQRKYDKFEPFWLRRQIAALSRSRRTMYNHRASLAQMLIEERMLESSRLLMLEA